MTFNIFRLVLSLLFVLWTEFAHFAAAPIAVFESNGFGVAARCLQVPPNPVCFVFYELCFLFFHTQHTADCVDICFFSCQTWVRVGNTGAQSTRSTSPGLNTRTVQARNVPLTNVASVCSVQGNDTYFVVFI